MNQKLELIKHKAKVNNLLPIWYSILNSYFYILNNITHIFTYFFIHTYINNTQTTLPKLLYQTSHSSLLLKPNKENKVIFFLYLPGTTGLFAFDIIDIRAFTLKHLKNLVFNNSKYYFIYFNNLLYNTP